MIKNIYGKSIIKPLKGITMKILKNIILLGLVVFSISKVVFAEVDYYNQVVFLKAKRNLLNIDPSIEHIDFDLTKYHTSLNDSILKNTLVKKAIKYNGLTVENFQDKVQFSIEIKRLITKRKPLQIERIFDPPFDTLRKDFRGKLVKVPDLSLHYKIIFQNKNDQVNFIKEIREFIGVLNVEKPIPPEFIQKDSNVPPGEEFYQNQWYLNEPNGAQVESAWEIQRDNEDVIIHINEIGGGGSLTSLNHEDLNANIIHSDIAPSDDHFIRVTGVASAVTDNNTGIAGTAYNSKIYLTVSPENDYVAAANYLKAAADYQPHEIRIANFSWHMQYHSQALYDACQYAYNDGMFLVCSGGNDSGRDDNNYPPNYDQYIMAV